MNDPHQALRLRREPRRRSLVVVSKTRLTPNMCRITFTSPQLDDFACPGADDHFKLAIPSAAAPDGEFLRTYTPRRFVAETRTLVVDFAMHEAGPATTWARHARPGDRIDIIGPKKSIVVADDFDWYLLVGDMTALPAIGRYLETLRAGVPVTSIVAIPGMDDRQRLATATAWQARWIEYGDLSAMETALRRAVAEFSPPTGDGYVWIATEGAIAATLRDDMTGARGHPAGWLKSSAYWHRTKVPRTEHRP